MSKDDYFLVLRNGVLYKAKVEALSSLFATNNSLSDLSSSIESMSDMLSGIVVDFQDNYYSKSEMQATFCTKQNVSSLTANAEYVLTSQTPPKVNELKNVTAVDVWHAKESRHCAKYLLKAYDEIEGIMRKSGNSDAQDYIKQPSVDSVIDENGDLVENTGAWEPNG